MGRKTDTADNEWLAVLARFGLVRASEINRLHKILDDGGIKLGGVVSDINGVSARAMVNALIPCQCANAARSTKGMLAANTEA